MNTEKLNEGKRTPEETDRIRREKAKCDYGGHAVYNADWPCWTCAHRCRKYEDGAARAMCDAYRIKPCDVMFYHKDCPYYLNENSGTADDTITGCNDKVLELDERMELEDDKAAVKLLDHIDEFTTEALVKTPLDELSAVFGVKVTPLAKEYIYWCRRTLDVYDMIENAWEDMEE